MALHPLISGRQDLNLRPHAPHACALPGCATPRASRKADHTYDPVFMQKRVKIPVIPAQRELPNRDQACSITLTLASGL